MVVITGGTKGIGKALVQKFSSEGHHIATCARNAPALNALKKEIEHQYGNKVYVQTADLSVTEDLNTFISFTKRIGEPIEVLINNTGVFIPGAIHAEEAGSLRKMIDTNLYSAYDITRAFIGEMMERKSGHIFNICSIASITAYANGGSYAISKHAMYGFSKCLREEMKEYGVKVTAVLPGATYTASWEGAGLPEERFSKASDIAAMIYATYQLSANSDVEEILIRPQLGDI